VTLNTEKRKNEEKNLLPGDLLPVTWHLVPVTCYLGGLLDPERYVSSWESVPVAVICDDA